jgi:fatty-acyl-CoA synthase
MKPKDTNAWPATMPHSIAIPATNLCHNLQIASVRYPLMPLLIEEGGSLAYGDAWGDIERIAGYLKVALRIERGARVMMFMQNSRAFLLAYFAILRIGGVVVPVNPMNRRGELAHYLEDAQVEAAFCDGTNIPELLNCSNSNSLRAIIVSGLEATSTDASTSQRIVNLEEVLRSAHVPDELPQNPDDLALILYSSGTTGVPKGCMHTHRSLMASAGIVATWQLIYPGSVTFAALPWFHITGMQNLLNAPIHAGATIVLQRRWEREAAAAMIARHRVTHWTAMPTMVIDFLASPRFKEYDLRSVRRIGGGGAAMPEAVGRQLFDATGLSFLEGYGLSETAHALGNPPHRPKRQCLGIPLFDTDVRIVDPVTLCEVPVGSEGEIVISGPQIFQGYWHNPKATEEASCQLDGQRFVRTGDLGRVDEEGYFFILDRLKRMVNASGYKVWPAEVEAMLHEHPDVQEACVIASHDQYRGETVKAVIVLKASRNGLVLEQDIINWARERMAAYKYPRLVEFVAELPKSPTGKVAWRVLQEQERARCAAAA